jgi:hybrid cluster-associated redox disulfide protein
MQETKQELISKDMTIGEVISKHPQVANTLMSYGLQCVGCHINTMETLEQGCIGHGMPEETFNEMMIKVNEVAATSSNEESKQTKDGNKQPIILTETAIKKVKELIAKEENAQGLRVGLVAGGCSGLSYDLAFDEQREDDKVVELDGLKVSGFKIENPNVQSTCGCGSSFS